MSLFHKDEPKKDGPTKEELDKRAQWEKDVAKAKAMRESGVEHDLENAPEVVDQTVGANRVVGSNVIGADRAADDLGGVASPDARQVHDHVSPAEPKPFQSAPNPVDHGVGTVEREIAVTTGDHGEVVDVQEVDAGSKKGKGKR